MPMFGWLSRLVLDKRAREALKRSPPQSSVRPQSATPQRKERDPATALAEAEVEVEPGEPLILKRRVKADGGSKAFINDQPVGVALLRELAPALVELHGQHDDRGLVNPRGHRALLDRYCGGDAAAVATVSAEAAPTAASDGSQA